jgi:isopentenyldiphosphate isomerase
MDDELLDLVNERDEVIGTVGRNDPRLGRDNIGYVRGVQMFIQNSVGKLWVPTRNTRKKIAPGGLDYSMGGHVGTGEAYMAAALREIQEELNMTLAEGDLEFIVKIPPGVIPYFCCLYIYKSNNEPQYNKEDFTSATWLTAQEIIDKLDAGVPAKSNLRETVKFLL